MLGTSRELWRSVDFLQRAQRFRATTTGAVHIRARVNNHSVLTVFVWASLPALVVRMWQVGYAYLQQGGVALPARRAELLQALGLAPTAETWQSCVIVGATFLVPLLLVALAVSLFWTLVFSSGRQRPADPAWFAVAWLYALLLPGGISPLLAALGMSFGAVLGQHVFGGTGRYLVSPAALGVLVVQFSYPDSVLFAAEDSWNAIVAVLATDGAAAQLPGSLSNAALSMSVACALGVALLVHAGAVSWRLVAGAVAGILAAAVVAPVFTAAPIATLPGHWHWALGSVPVCAAFVLGDPSTSALTRSGRWLHGLIFGMLVVAIRTFDPSHPDGALFAVLLATLFVPLLDHVVLRRRLRRGGGRLEVIR